MEWLNCLIYLVTITHCSEAERKLYYEWHKAETYTGTGVAEISLGYRATVAGVSKMYQFRVPAAVIVTVCGITSSRLHRIRPEAWQQFRQTDVSTVCTALSPFHQSRRGVQK
jgi:hypothetical protein